MKNSIFEEEPVFLQNLIRFLVSPSLTSSGSAEEDFNFIQFEEVLKELYKLGCAVTFSFCIFLQGVQCPETRGTVRALGDWSAEIS